MKTFSNYLIIMLAVMLFIFRIIVVFTTTMGIEFIVQSSNVNFEMIFLFINLVCIILMTKGKLLGAIIYVFTSLLYFGADLVTGLRNFSSNTMTLETGMQTIISFICVIIPIFAFFIIAMAKKQEKKPVDKKTDFFYKNEAYDRKYDKRADKNNYRTM